MGKIDRMPSQGQTARGDRAGDNRPGFQGLDDRPARENTNTETGGDHFDNRLRGADVHNPFRLYTFCYQHLLVKAILAFLGMRNEIITAKILKLDAVAGG